ncbi:MAG: hypothetical protein H7343_07630 [Undibacterium sp.]|nr:hypothetical protein [Opitutaceae bacterium]
MNPRPIARFSSRLLALAVFSALVLPATPSTPATTESTPTVSAYTNQPTPTYVETYVPTYTSNNYNGFDSSRSFGNSGFTTSGYYSSYELFTFYFPPTPPALGAPILLFRRYSLGQPETTLPQLLPYVGEPFYAPLSAHLHREDLTKKQLARLDAYQAGRSAALGELHAKLATIRESDAPTRARALADFAAQQTPRLAALETEAEALRENLVNGSFTQSAANWNDNRTWSLGDDVRYESRVDEFKVIRASAFFASGLSPAQRRLLREFAMELDEPLGEPTAAIALDAAKPLFFFAPETARIELPADLAPEVTAKLDAYRDAKAALKAELRAVIYKQDRAFFTFTRTKALRALSELQAPRLAALEAQAEELRRLLASYPRPSRPPMSFLPDELSARISTYLREKQELQRSLVDKLAATKADFPQHRVEYARQGEGYGVEIITSRRANRSEDARVEAIKTQLVKFNADQSRRFSTLTQQKNKIQTDLTQAVKAKLKPAGNNVDMDLLLRNFASQFAQQETWQRYRDYDTAVLEPGLSPEQRRLLYADALVQLDLPLPRGSRSP